MTVHQEGQAMNGLFSMLLHLYLCQNITLDLFLDGSGFLSSMTFCISMKFKLEFLDEDFVLLL